MYNNNNNNNKTLWEIHIKTILSGPVAQLEPNFDGIFIGWSSSKIVSSSRALPPRRPPQCSCVVIESSFDPGERLQAPGSLWFNCPIRRTVTVKTCQKPVIAHLVFNLTSKVEIENGGVTHNFESGPPKDHFNSNF